MTTPDPKPNFLPPTQKTTPPLKPGPRLAEAKPGPHLAEAKAARAEYANLPIKDRLILPDDGPVYGVPLLRKD